MGWTLAVVDDGDGLPGGDEVTGRQLGQVGAVQVEEAGVARRPVRPG